MSLDLETLKSHPLVLNLYREKVALKKESGSWIGKCPFHSDSNPSFSVTQKDGKWLWKCFTGCGGGSIIDLVQKLENCSVGEAVKIIKEKLGMQTAKLQVDQVFKPAVAEETKKFSISVDTYSVMEKGLSEKTAGQEYLKSRGISYNTALMSGVGFRTELPGFEEKDWLCFPTYTGEFVTGIKYRNVHSKKFSSQKGGKPALFNAKKIDPLKPLFVVEGEMDVLAFQECGYNAVSIGSAQTKLTPEQKDQLLEAENVYLAGDNDPPGQESMQRLWADLQERTYLLRWPTEVKDANELLMKTGIVKFKEEIVKLMAIARSSPMPNVVSLQESLATSTRTNLADHPARLRFPWSGVDKMAILLPGSVMAISATNTKMGKTCFVKEFTLYNALRGEVVLFYSCELSNDEFANMVAAGVLEKNRNHLTKEDNIKASKKLTGVKYYIGRNPTLVTVEPVLDLIEAAIRRLSATVVVLDHLHFICRNSDNEVKSQADAMQRIKNMAVKYGVKFIVIMQPRKANQTTRGKVIHVTDFKGSEAGTSDADAIFCLHREYVKIKDPSAPPMDDYDPKMEVHLLGARAKGDGPTYAELFFEGSYGRIVELAKEESQDF